MSYYCYSFEIKNIKSVKEYLFILKNCLRLAYKNNVYENFFHKRLHVSYCTSNKEYFYTVNSSKTKTYFFSENSILRNFEIEDQLDILKLKKYSNRLIEFELYNNILYPIALYNSNKKILSAYSDLYSYFAGNKNINSLSLNLQIKLKDYQKDYNKFLIYLKKISILEETLENFFSLNLKVTDEKISYSSFDKIFKTNGKPLKNQLFYYIIFLISIEFNRFFNCEFSLLKKSFCIYDKSLNKIIKFPFNFYCNVYKKEDKEMLPPLLPVSF
jgi:hypothetical protein